MSYNFVNQASSIRLSPLCKYDSNRGYETDFSENGNVSGWDFYSGVHTYGSWNGYLFGTVFKSEALIGRTEVFTPVPAEFFYTIRIAMKITPKDSSEPSTARIMWRTIGNPSWNTDKQVDFDIIADNKWHVYTIDVGQEQYWQGDVYDLRLYPIFDGSDEDEFYIRHIQIVSTSTFRCTNGDCSYFLNYEHNCPGVGTRGTCTSAEITENVFSFESGVSDELYVNINDYGFEIVKLKALQNENASTVSRMLTTAISRLDIGGYAEVEVDYDEDFNKFIIYSGTYDITSTVEIGDTPAARILGFRDSSGNDVSVKTIGTTSATGAAPQCSFRLKSFQLADIFDGNSNTYVDLDPFDYGVEGGRSDYAITGLGGSGAIKDEESGRNEREYETISNYGKTLIDFSHPFNASGKVKKIYAACTQRVRLPGGGLTTATGCKIKIYRPRRGGSYEYITSVDIPDRESGLYSTNQEFVVLDCDIHVNKGDVIAIYNADVYVGVTEYGDPDAAYKQVDGDHTGIVEKTIMDGEGTAGFVIYARSDFKQDKLLINIDLGHRYNIQDVVIEGATSSDDLEFNIARCLDINWQVDLKNGTHTCGYFNLLSGFPESFTYPNEAFGLNRLSDGEYMVENGLAAESYTASDAAGLSVTNAGYFFVNGDQEWLTEVLFSELWKSGPYVEEFDEDPIILYLDFPRQTKKYLKRSVIYFKEYENFKSFGISYLSDPQGVTGNADDSRYTYIPEYTKVTTNGLEYYEGMALYSNVDAYLFSNPCEARAQLSNYDQDAPVTTTVLNYEEYVESTAVKWTTIEHEWEPVEGYGYRIRCDYHKSTKINEIEVFCATSDVGTSLAGSVSVLHSPYEEFWTAAETNELSSEEVEMIVGDTPRYFTIEVNPITNVRLKNIKFNLGSGALFTGDKGCEYDVVADDSKTGATNSAQVMSFKNTFGRNYNLYIDIANPPNKQEGLIFFSKLDSDDAISNPVVGPDAFYTKRDNYPLIHQNYNCAINCECYGLKNLVDGKDFYYSKDGGLTWHYYLTADSDTDLDFSNHDGAIYRIKFTPASRNRYWRIGFLADAYTLNVKEAKFLYQGNVVEGDFYYDQNLDLVFGPAAEDAPHLDNISVTGSYYTLSTDDLITLDLGSSDLVDEIVLFGQALVDYHNHKAGIDTYTKLLFRPESGSIIEASYFDKSFSVVGSGIEHSITGGYFTDGCISFPGSDDSYILVDNSSDYIDFDLNRFTIDMKIRFDSLPALGEEVILASCWDGALTTSDGAVVTNDPKKNWAFTYRNDAGTYKFSFYQGFWNSNNGRYEAERNNSYAWTATPGTWYTIMYCRGGYNADISEFNFMVDGASIGGQSGSYKDITSANNEIVIGKGFNGALDEIRISQGPRGTYGQGTGGGRGWYGGFTVFTERYAPLYSFSIFVSDDNAVYGKLNDVDTKYEYRDFEYEVGSAWSETYNTYLAVDLEQRYSIDFIRNYGVSSPTDLSGKLSYSTSNTSDPYSVVYSSDETDARWVRIEFLNSSTLLTVNNLGIYPTVTSYLAPVGGYNSQWQSIGNSLTNYTVGENVALNATVSGSSYFDDMILSRITEGLIGDNLSQAWGSDSEDTQWVSIDLGEIKSLYRFKIYHGYDDSDTSFMNVAYSIQVSEDDNTYTTVFNITGNSLLERTHDLTDPVNARWVKINITDYNTVRTRRRLSTGVYGYFQGAVLREVEIYEYYGFSAINSEEWPVIAIDLKEKFYLQGLGGGGNYVGIDEEDTSTDWTESTSNVAYSDSFFSDPQKVSFTDWGQTGGSLYKKWVLLKQNTATGFGSGPDYLKHVRVKATTKHNPCEFYWWWNSSISTLSNDTNRVVNTNRSLRINYPTSSGTDIVHLNEGDTFGTDSYASWRDGFSFNIYISDADKLDTDFGYFYFGNQDRDVEYRWNINTLYNQGAIKTGWTSLFLRFKAADEHLYEEPADVNEVPDNVISLLELKSIGMVYRGKGSAFEMNLDGFNIVRNKFNDFTIFGNGLYMTGLESLITRPGQFDITRGTVEFFFRPDYTPSGQDDFFTLKQRNLFCFSSVANDILGAFVYGGDIGFYFGNINESPQVFLMAADDYWEIDQAIHLAFAFSNDGSGTDDGSTMKVYVNGVLISFIQYAWNVNDSRGFTFSLGGKAPYVVSTATNAPASSMDAVVSYLKIHNYCKSDFTDSLEQEESDVEELMLPSQMVELSADNLTFYDVESGELPLVFYDVPDGDTVEVYVRTKIPKGLTGKEKRTAGIIASWDVGV
jgi:hypothetical protein